MRNSSSQLKYVRNLTRDELSQVLQAQGYSVVHAPRLFRLLYSYDIGSSFRLKQQLPRQLVNIIDDVKLKQPVLKLAKYHISDHDQSVKFVFSLADGSGQIESVLMPEKKRLTLCISSQLGCAQGCAFCHTARMGLIRSLQASEIVAQVVEANLWIQQHLLWCAHFVGQARRVTHIVFMGMGEPLDNVNEVVKAIKILTDPHGLNIAMRHISVSTAGHLDGLVKLLEKCPRIPVALSLHAVSDNLRSKLMPINRRYPLADVLASIKHINNKSNKPVLVQYILIKGVNDRLEDAECLAKLLHDCHVKINLIPFNSIEPSLWERPSISHARQFQHVLHQHGYRVMLRFSKGQDIAAACGQLVKNKC